MSKRIAPTLTEIVEWWERSQPSQHVPPAAARRELRDLLALVRAVERVKCEPPPGMKHDPDCIVCRALARLRSHGRSK